MDKSKVQAWVDANIEGLKKKFGIPDWRVTFEYLYMEDCYGKCKTDLAYQDATISLCFDSLQDEKHLAEVLNHELMHIIHAPFDLVLKTIHEAIDNAALYNTIYEVFRNAEEMTARNLEKMHEGHKKFYSSRPPIRRVGF